MKPEENDLTLSSREESSTVTIFLKNGRSAVVPLEEMDKYLRAHAEDLEPRAIPNQKRRRSRMVP